ncbi:MAG TPA: hypothetical protein PKE49_19585, partial [Leptospiraceae bacterium]|nr:hypothetical protein [Leptospiraceae bacterium]
AIIELSIELGTLERGKRWLDSAMVADPGRNDAGGRELLVGKWFFANGELDKAKELFSIANAKSRGRIFAGADPRYRALVAETNPQTQKKKRGK